MEALANSIGKGWPLFVEPWGLPYRPLTTIRGAAFEFLGGSDRYEQMRTTARTQGFAPFTTFWGQDQKLGYQWFTDMEASKPASSIHHYQGALFVLYGDLDTIVKPEISRSVLHKAVNAKPAIEHQVTGADHGLGLFNDDTVRSDEVIQSTIEFFAEHL